MANLYFQHRYWLVLAGGVSLLALMSSASAESENGGQIESVTVTAQKVSSDLQKTPLSVTAIGSNTLDQSNIASVKDLDATVPGVVVNTTPSNPLTVTIRGAGYEGIENNSAQPSVSFNENGVYITNPVGANANFLDVDHVEVLRGPQGTVLGQNSDGGALNVTTTRPQLDNFSGDLNTSYGSYNYERQRGDLNVPIGGTMALRLAAQQEHHDGWANATGVPGTNGKYQLSDENSFNGRADLLWKPTDPLTVELWAEHYQNNAHGEALKNIYDPNPDPREITQDHPSAIHQESDIVSANVGYDLGWATAKLVTSYQFGKLAAPEDLDKLDFATAISVYGVHDIDTINSRLGHSFTQEFDLASTPGGRLDWIVGAFAMEQTYNEQVLEFQYTNPNLVLPTDIYLPGPIFATNSLAFEARDTQKLESDSVYAQGTYHITDSLRFTGGIRGTLDNQAGYVSTFFAAPVTLKTNFKAFTGKADLEYDLTPDNTVYAMWSSGIKPGGTNLNPTAEVIPTVFRPESNNAYEVGSKNEFLDKKIRLNMSAFYNRYHDYQSDSEDPLPYQGGLTNIKAVHTYGLETELSALLPYNLRFDGNFSAMGGKVDSNEKLLDPEIAQEINKANGGPFVGNDLAQRAAAFASDSSDLYGRTPPKLPPFTSNLALKHTLNLPDGSSITSQAKFTYRASYWFRIYNNPATDKVPDMRQWDLNFTYLPPTGNWHADFIVTNLTNNASVNSRYTDSFGVGAVVDYFVPPRQFIGRLAYSF
jgi:iron complex outermembrane receptor protein